MDLINILVNDESGQGLVEYALIAGLIALGCVVAMTALGTNIGTLWSSISNKVNAAAAK